MNEIEKMLQHTPPEGKCMMLLAKRVDGELVWGSELYDFASYVVVDKDANTFTGSDLNDPFERADFADKLTLAKKLRRMAASLDEQSDVLGVIDEQVKQIDMLENLVMIRTGRANGYKQLALDMYEELKRIIPDAIKLDWESRMAALGLEGEEYKGGCQNPAKNAAANAMQELLEEPGGHEKTSMFELGA